MGTVAQIDGALKSEKPLMVRNISGQDGLDGRKEWAQAIVLLVLYSSLAISCLHNAGFIADPDVWWHMSTGEWVIRHHALPHIDTFCSATAGKTWSAYSWLFDLLIFGLFQRLGLVGIATYTVTMVLAITVAIHRMLRKTLRDFSYAVGLTAVACICLSRLWTPRPWLFTILFFIVECDLLMTARRSGKNFGLLWLPPLFALWANLHIQFIDGLVVLAIAIADGAFARRLGTIGKQVSLRFLCAVTGACVLATWVNPYGWHIYRDAYDLATQKIVLSYVSEMQALPFRDMTDWGVLLLTLSAVCVLARSRRNSVFETVLLLFAIYLSFRSQRDIWAVTIVSSVLLASRIRGAEKNRFCVRASLMPVILAATVVVVACAGWLMKVNNRRLGEQVMERLPVRAVQVVKDKGLQGPLYNDYNWGGYLIWALRVPVSIDGRAALQGDEHIKRSVAAWQAQPAWTSDPDFAKAKLVIGPVKSPLTQVLRLDPEFHLIFEDKLAAVFVSNGSPEKRDH